MTMKRIWYPFRNRAAVGLLAGALAVAASAYASKKLSRDEVQRISIKLPVDETAINREQLPNGSYAPVVAKVTPAVVKLTTVSKVTPVGPDLRGFNDPFWRRFFGDQFGQTHPHGPNGRLRPQTRNGLGSGVIVTEDGYILTNNHVIDGANEIKVALQDGREFTAKVVGRDPKSDLAVIKVDANDLPVVTLTDSDKVQIGDVALAIGNPFGVGQTVTSGIVSATQRGGIGIEAYEDFIQTDAAINPGNSGGALVDIQGRLIGINTAILSRSGGNHGVGFAIPSNLARSVMESLIQDGHVTRGYLGVNIQNITPELAEAFNLEDRKGALVGGVMPDSPASKAGLRSGDVILKFNGTDVTDSRRLQLAVAQSRPGSEVPVEILRDGKRETLALTVKQLPGEKTLASNSPDAERTALEGVTVDDLNARSRSQFNIPEDVKGAVVAEIAPGSAAAESGLRVGDVILEINRQRVNDAADAVRLSEKQSDGRTLVRVWQNGGSRYVVVNEQQKVG